MAGNTTVHTLRIQTDAAKAKQELTSVMDQLRQISQTQTIKLDTASVQHGVQGARDLEKALTAAVNVDTGRLNLSKFQQSLKSSNTDLKTIYDQMCEFGPSGEAAFNRVSVQMSKMHQEAISLNGELGKFAQSLANTVKWQISSTIVHALASKLSEAVGFAKQLNGVLTDINIVTGYTSSQMADVSKQIATTAKALSTSVIDMGKAATIYFQQGDNTARALEKAAITVKAANISFSSTTQEMSEMLTAVWNSYQAGEDQMQHMVDVMAALGATTASSMEEIATGMQKVAATANTVGVSMEQMSAIIATVASVTREAPESIGTAYKTILARMGDLKMGETLEDGVGLGQVSSSLKSIGVDVLDANGDLREMGTVIEEVGAKWQGMTSAQKQSLAIVLAGKRQYTQLMALFENMDKYQTNMNTANASAGTLDSQFDVWEESYEGATSRMKNSWQELYMQLTDDKAFIGAINGFSKLVDSVTAFADALGGLQTLVPMIGGLLLTNFAKNGKVSEALGALGNLTGLSMAKRKSLKQENEMMAIDEANLAGRKASGDIVGAANSQAAINTRQLNIAQLKHKGTLTKEQEAELENARQRMLTANDAAYQSAAQQKQLENTIQADHLQSDATAKGRQFNRDLTEQTSEKLHNELDSSIEDLEIEPINQDILDKYNEAQEKVAAAQAEVDKLNAEGSGASNRKKREAQDRLSVAQGELAEAQAEKDKADANTEALKERQDRANSRLKDQQEIIDTDKGDGATRIHELQRQQDKAQKDKQEAQVKLNNINGDPESTKEARDKAAEEFKQAEKTEREASAQKEAAKIGREKGGLDQAQKSVDDMIQARDDMIAAIAEGAEDKAAEATSQIVQLCDQAKTAYASVIEELTMGGQAQEALSGLGDAAVKKINDQSVSEDDRQVLTKQTIMDSLTGQIRNDKGEAIGPAQRSISNNAESAVDDAIAANRASEGYDKLSSEDKTASDIKAAQAAYEEYLATLNEVAEAEAAVIEAGGGNAEQLKENATAQAEAEMEKNQHLQESAQALEDSKKTLSQGAKTLSDGIAEAAGGAMQVVGGIQAIGNSIETLNSSEATGLQKVAAVMGILTSVTAVLNGLKAVGNGLTAVQNVLAMTSVGKHLAEAAAKTTNAAATIALKLAQLGLVGAIIAGVAALGAAIVALVKWATSIKSTSEKLAELDAEMAVLTARSAEAKNKMTDISKAMQKVGAIVHDTTKSFAEQAAALNEITEQYGVTVTELDLMSGGYAALETRVGDAMRAAQEDVQLDLEQIQIEQKANLQKQADLMNTLDEQELDSPITQFFENIGLSLKKAFYDIQAWWYGLVASINEWLGNLRLDIANSFINIVNSIFDVLNKALGWLGVDIAKLEKQTSNSNVETAEHYRALQASAQAKSAATQDQIDTNYNERHRQMAEGSYELEQWEKFTTQFSADLQEMGFVWDADFKRLKAIEGQEQNYDQLYELMTQVGATDWADGDSWTQRFYQQLLDMNADDVAANNAALRQSEMMTNLYKSDNMQVLDVMGISTATKDLQALDDLIDTVAQDIKGVTVDDLSYVLDQIGGYDGWSQLASQYKALGQLAVQIKDIQVDGSFITPEEIHQALVDYVLTNDDGITVETLLYVRPSAIKIQPDGTVTVDDKEALEYAQAMVQRDEHGKQKKAIEAVRAIDTKETIDQTTYDQLLTSDYFNGDVEKLNAYVHMSSGARALQLQQDEMALLDASMHDNEAIVQEGTQAAEELRTEIDNFYATLAAPSGVSEDIPEDLTGVALYDELIRRKQQAEKLNTAAADLRAKYGSSELTADDATGEEARAWLDGIRKSLSEADINQVFAALGITNWADLYSGDNNSEFEQLFTWWKNQDEGLGNNDSLTYRGIASAHTTDARLYANATDSGEQLNNELLNIEANVGTAQRALDGDAFAEWAKDVDKATRAAEGFTDAMSNAGEMSSKDLYALAEFDPEIIAKYNKMSSDEWTSYCREQALKYYDTLAASYEGDAAKQAEIIQQKKDINETYYSMLEDRTEAIADQQQEVWDKIRDAADDTGSALEKFITSPESWAEATNEELESLRQNLIKVGYTAEQAQQVIDNLMDPTKSKEDRIKTAGATLAHSQMAAMSTLYEEQNQFNGKAVLVEYDASQIEPIPVETDAEVTEVIPPDEIPDFEATSTIISADGSSATVENVEYKDGQVFLTTADGSTATVQSVDYTNGSVTLLTADGSTATVQGVTYEDGSVAIKTADGSAAVISGVNYTDGSVTLTTADGSKAKVTGIAYKNGTVTIDTADGSAATVSGVDDYEGGTVTLLYADGGSATLSNADTLSFAGGKLSLTSADGSGLNGTELAEGTEIIVSGGQLQLDEAIEGDIQSTSDDGSYKFVVEGGCLHLATAETGSELAEKEFELKNGKLVLAHATDSVPDTEKTIDGEINITTQSVNLTVNYTEGAGSDLIHDRTITANVTYKEAGQNYIYEGWANKIRSNLEGKGATAWSRASNFTWEDAAALSLTKDRWTETNRDSEAGKVAGLVKLNEEVRNLTQSEWEAMDDTAKQGMVNYLTTIRNMANSSNQAIRNIGSMLISGLPVGMQEALASTDWAGSVEGLGAILYTIFASEAQTASPSKMTKKIGHYLVEGLSVGISEGVASEDWAEDVAGVGAALDAAWRKEIEKVGDGTSIIPSNYKAQIEAAGQTAYDTTYSFLAGDRTERELRQGYGLDPGHLLSDYLYIQQEAEAARAAAEEAKGIEFGELFQEDWFNGGYLESDELTEVTKVILKQAIANADEQGIDKGSQEYLDSVQKYLKNHAVTIQGQIDMQWATVQDTLFKTAQAVYDNEVEQAQKTYEVWEKTYKAIAEARKGLITGDSIAETFLDDIESQAAIIGQLLDSGKFKTVQEIIEYLHNPQADPSALMSTSFGTSEWQHAGNQQFLNWQNGQVQTTTMEQYNAKATARAKELASDGFEDFWTDTADGTMKSYAQELAEYNELLSKNVDDLTKADRVRMDELQKKFAPFIDNEVITQDANAPTYSLAEGNDLQADLEKALIRAFTLDEEGFNAIYEEAIARTSNDIKKQISTAADMGTTYISEIDEDKALVNKAREALLKGEDLERALAPEEMIKLQEIMGDLPITTGNLTLKMTELDSAAHNCASALQQLATLIMNGEVNTGSVDENGQVHAFKETQEETTLNYNTRGYEREQKQLLNEGWEQGAIDEDGTIHFSRLTVDEVEIPDGTAFTKTENETIDDEAIGTAAEHLREINEEAIKSYGDAVGYTTEEFHDLIDALLQAGGETRKFDEMSAEEQRDYMELAETIGRVNQAWNNLSKNGKNLIKTLKNTNTGTEDYRKTLKSLTKDVKQFFGDSGKVTDKFVQEHMADIEKMIDGDENALERIQDDLINLELGEFKDKTITINGDIDTSLSSAIDTLEDQFKNLQDGAVITPEMDTSGAVGALLDLWSSGDEAAQGIQDALNAVGYTPEIEYEDVDIKNLTDADGNVRIPVVDYVNGLPAGFHYESAPTSANLNEDGTIHIPKINPKTGKLSTNLKKTGSGQHNNKTKTPSSGGGGGGGGSQPKKQEHKKLEDEVDRYYDITNQLSKVAKELEKIDKLKERAFGKGKLNLLKEETKALEDQISKQEEYIDQIKEYIDNVDEERVKELGAKIDDDGIITNYDEIVSRLVSEYNAQADMYSTVADPGEAWEDYQKHYEEQMAWLEKYKEQSELYQDEINNLYDMENKLSAQRVETAAYEVEYKLDINDRDLDLIEYYQDKWEDDLVKSGERMSGYLQSASLYYDNLVTLGNELDTLADLYANKKIYAADFEGELENINDAIQENLESLNEIEKDLAEAYADTLDLYDEQFEKSRTIMDNANDQLSTYIDLLGSMGRGKNFKELSKFYESQYKIQTQTLAAQKESLDLLYAELEKMGDRDKLSKLEQDHYDEIISRIGDVNSQMLDDTQTCLDTVRTIYENTIEQIFLELDQQMGFISESGDRTLSELAASYEYYTGEQERYVSSSRQIYENAKMNRQIEESINGATTRQSKQMLKALQEKINLQDESNRLTQYDLDMNELQYQLALKKMALEEAQNAKDTVQLTRDSNGNYIYRYTANEDELAKKRQEYEDVLQQINDLALNREAEIESQYLETEQNYIDRLREIANDKTLTEEEANEKILELQRQTEEELLYLQQQYETSTANLLTSNSAITEYYGESLIRTADQTAAGINAEMQAVIANTAGIIESMRAAADDGSIQDALKKQYDAIDAVNAISKLTPEAMAESIERIEEYVVDSSDAIDKLIDTMKDEFGEIDNVTQAWNNQAAALDAAILKYETMQQVVLDTIDALAELDTKDYQYAAEAVRNSDPVTNAAVDDSSNVAQHGLWTLPPEVKDAIADIKPAELAFAATNMNESMTTLLSQLSDYKGAATAAQDQFFEQIQTSNAAIERLAANNQTAYADWVASLSKINETEEFNLEYIDSLLTNLGDFRNAVCNYLSNISSSVGTIKAAVLEQQVYITAEFPNVTDSIEALHIAFEDAALRAAQMASSHGTSGGGRGKSTNW